MTLWERMLKFLDRWFPSNERRLWESWANIDDMVSPDEVAPELQSEYLLRLSTVANGTGIVASVGFIGAALPAPPDRVHIAADAYWTFVIFVFGSFFAVVGHVLYRQFTMGMRQMRLGGEEVRGLRGLKSKLIVLTSFLLPLVALTSLAFLFAGLFWAMFTLYPITAGVGS